MAAASDSQPQRDKAREHLERSRRLRGDMMRAGDAVVYHLRRAAQLRREAARNGR
jgi:hypothetical protein